MNGARGLLASTAVRNAAWNVGDFVSMPLLMLAAAPLFLRTLGAERYGIWMLINSVVAAVSVMNAGLGEATVRFVSRYRGAGDEEGVRRVAATTFSLSLLAFAAMAAAGLAGALLVGRFGLLRFSPAVRGDAAFAVAVGSLTAGVRLVEQVLLGLFRGYERFDVSAPLSIVSKSAAVCTNMALAARGFGLPALFVSGAGAAAAGALAAGLLALRFFPGLRLRPRFQAASVAEVFSFGTWAWLQSVLGTLAMNLDRYIVAAWAGAAMLAHYCVGQMVAVNIHLVLAAAAGWVFPHVSRRGGAGGADLGPLYRRLQGVVVPAGLAVVAALYFVRGPVFRAWLGPETYARTAGFIEAFLCYETLFVTTIVPFYFFSGTGYIRYSALFSLAAALTMPPLMLLFHREMGPVGLAWGRSVQAFLSICVQFPLLHAVVLRERDPFAGLRYTAPGLLLTAAMSWTGGGAARAALFIAAGAATAALAAGARRERTA